MAHKSFLAPRPMLIALTFTLLLQGCASAPRFKELTSVPENKALIYIYREKRMLGAAGSWEVFVNGKEIVKMSNGGYYVHTLEPGPVVISHRPGYGPLTLLSTSLSRPFEPEKEGVISFMAESNGVYYIEWVIALTPKMEMRDYETAIKTLKESKLLKSSVK
jgi:hypothetical protein